MALVRTKSEFHVALDGVGLLLQGAPDRLAYAQDQATVYGQRFARGAGGYNDLSKWWYLQQTDWSGGFKDVVTWADDAKFYASSNIDAFSEPGAIKAAKSVVLHNTFTENVKCGGEYEVGGTSYPF